MTGDELAAALYAEQGYMALAQNQARKHGEIIPPGTCGWEDAPITTPLRVIGDSNRDEWGSQKPIIARALGLQCGPVRGNAPYYYRVEAAD